MRKLLIILTLFYSLTVLGQNGVKGKYFLLLEDKRTISLNTYEDSKIKEHGTFEISSKSIYTTDKRNRVAILDTAKKQITIHEIDSRKKTNLSVPFNIEPKTILIHGDNLFVGGEMGKEMLIQYQIDKAEWFHLEIPKEIMHFGKAVDDLVINDSLLIAIDNIIMPKYVLYYNLNQTDKLELSHFKELKSNGPYESIYAGRITSNYFGLISGTYSGYSGASDHITIYDNLELKRSFAISIGQQEGKYHTFKDFVIVENKLFIASKEKGLGVFEIKDSYFKLSNDQFDHFNEEVSANKIRYKSYRGTILNLSLTPNKNNLILTIKNVFGFINHEIIKI